MRLRLLITEACNRDCEGCCNKDWDLKNLPEATTFEGFEEIMLTGGEPMLDPDLVVHVVQDIKDKVKTPVYVYTAKIDEVVQVGRILVWADGMTVTLHDQGDVDPFVRLNDYLLHTSIQTLREKSLRLNIFTNVTLPNLDLKLWKVKSGIEWIDKCPLPTDEVFQRLVRRP